MLTAHEVGHGAGGKNVHPPDTSDEGEGGLMGRGAPKPEFSPKSISRFRDLKKGWTE